MKLWHRHRWTEVSRLFNPPVASSFKMTGSPVDPAEVLYGVTVVELRCEECGTITAVRYAGKA